MLLRVSVISVVLFSWLTVGNSWIAEKHTGYKLFYKKIDQKNKKEYLKLIKRGIKSVDLFFQNPFKNDFNIFIHPNRHSLDSTWQKDWSIPGFRSECWMVASGVASRLDMISPKAWDREACEHTYAETKKTQRLITHELVHVFHGQLNVSPDFGNVEGIDWFIEGLATFASGQCDSLRIAEIKNAILANTIPNGLDNFWTGKLKYGLSGSVVMYIHYKYGIQKIKELLPINKKAEMFLILKIQESELLEDWKNYMQSL